MIWQYLVNKERKRKKVAALMIQRHEKLGVVILNRFDRAEKCFFLCSLYIVFDEKLFSLVAYTVVKRITLCGSNLRSVFCF